MRTPAVALLAALLLAPTLGAQSPDARDHAAEVLGGAQVLAYLTYAGGATTSRSGAQEPYALHESRAHEVRWEGPLHLFPTGTAGKLNGGVMGEWAGRASSSRVWDYRSEHNSLHEESTCEGDAPPAPFGFQVEATPEPDGLRLRLTGYAVPSLQLPGACRWSRVETTPDGTDRDSGTSALEMNVALVHGLQGNDYNAALTLLVPYDGRATLPFAYSSAVPHDHATPASVYCAMPKGGFDWATGSCRATGTLTARVLVDPCPYIKRVYAQRHAALAGVQPPPAGSDEAAVRAWAAPVGEKVRAVLGDQRAWQLWGCEGDLEPDPWDAIARVLRMQRDALHQLLKEGKLSREGVSELLGAERAMQLMGVEDGAGSSIADVMAASPAQPSGTLEVRVHSPVSLHAWSEDGGHVGWDAAANASVSTIPGATHEGAPGGAQRIVLPAGYYKVTVDELEAGEYLLEVETNGTGADASEAFLVDARPDRTTSTHYAVTQGWEGPRLDAFPVRRSDTPDSVAFVDEGRPSVSGAAGGNGGDGGEGASGGGNGRDAPGPALGVVLLLVAAIALARRP